MYQKNIYHVIINNPKIRNQKTILITTRKSKTNMKEEENSKDCPYYIMEAISV